MKANEANLLNFLQGLRQFTIPIYQRTYSWQLDDCARLLADVERVSREADVPAHFLGSVVYFEENVHSIGTVPRYLVIDGQQRLTTITLLLTALARYLETAQEPDEVDITSRKLRKYYLFNAEEAGELQFKLVLTRRDKQTLMDVLKGNPLPTEPSERVQENFEYFLGRITTPQYAQTIYEGLQKLLIVSVALERGKDNPQLIFESLNSTGRELAQADLIRNYVLMGQEQALQTRLYEQYWFPMEQRFGTDYAWYFDSFVRDYLTVRTGQITRQNQVYEAYKTYLRDAPRHPEQIEQKLRELRDYAELYVRIVRPTEAEPHPGLRWALDDVLTLRADTATPFLLEVYHDRQQGHLTADEHVQVVRLVESYVFRRFICGIPTNSLNKTFAGLMRYVQKDRYVESLQAAFQLKDSYRRFPADAEFRRELLVKDVYNMRLRHYLLDKLENHERNEPVVVEEFTIEHIMPQNENLSKAWQLELGEQWEEVQTTYLHTLGNVTLTAYNSRLSDKPFAFKKTVEGGFADSPIRLNRSVAREATWNADAIRRRGKSLATKATGVWVAPNLSADELARYQAAPSARETVYELTQFGHLTGKMRELFDEFSTSVFQLDPTVKQEAKKLYIAFKADTNFVDVEPQKNRLRLSLNLPFAEIRDPHNIARDITAVGRWGNGDVEVSLANTADLEHVMPLVQQAFDWQKED